MRRTLLAALVVCGCSTEGVIGSLASGAPGDASVSGDSGAQGDGGPNALLPRAANAIGAGGASTCVRTADGHARCWGENQTGSLGIGDDTVASSAKPVAPKSLDHVAAIASGETGHCALRDDGKVFCWGDMFFGDFNGRPFDHLPVLNPFSIEGISDVARVAVGRYFTCLLATTGELRCFGLGESGQLGIGSTEKKYLPTTVTDLDGPVVSVAASMGGAWACAATRPGSLYCWGRNDRAQMGAGAGAAVTRPRRIDGFSEPVVEVAVGAAHACARTSSGVVRCFGANDKGQLGTGDTTASDTPRDVLYLSDVAGLASGRAHACAVRSEGAVLCWGDDADGQVGNTPDGKRPALILPASFAARFVACGIAHTCAWGDGGRVHCWGANASSQLGPVDTTL